MRKTLIVLIAAAFMAIGVGSAVAATSLQHSTTGAKFGINQSDVGNGYWEWYGNGVSCGGSCVGGFHWWGYVYDTICTDGDNVYTKVKVEGYANSSFYGSECTSGTTWGAKSQNRVMWDPQATMVSHAEFSVCRDRSFPYSDNCSTKKDMDR